MEKSSGKNCLIPKKRSNSLSTLKQKASKLQSIFCFKNSFSPFLQFFYPSEENFLKQKVPHVFEVLCILPAKNHRTNSKILTNFLPFSVGMQFGSLFFIFATWHSTLNAVCMIALTKPYRSAFVELIFRLVCCGRSTSNIIFANDNTVLNAITGRTSSFWLRQHALNQRTQR